MYKVLSNVKMLGKMLKIQTFNLNEDEIWQVSGCISISL